MANNIDTAIDISRPKPEDAVTTNSKSLSNGATSPTDKARKNEWVKMINRDRFFHHGITEEPKYIPPHQRDLTRFAPTVGADTKEEEGRDNPLSATPDRVTTKPTPLSAAAGSLYPPTKSLSASDRNQKEDSKPEADDEEEKKFGGSDDGAAEDSGRKQDTKYYTYYSPSKEDPKSKRRIAFFDGKLKRLSKIDAASETFHAEFHFYFTWLMSMEEVKSYYNAEARDKWEPEWKPELECENRVSGEITRISGFKCKEGSEFRCLRTQTPAEDFQYPHGQTSWDISEDHLGFDPEFAFWCRVKYSCSITCTEELELEAFPFDCQDFAVFLRLTEKANKCDLLPLPRYGEIFNLETRYSNSYEWKIPGVLLEFVQGDLYDLKAIPYNSVVLRIKAIREWRTYLSELMTVFCMFWLGLATFSIPEDDVGDRLAYCVTLLLAAIASMQFIQDTLPKIPYQTLFNVYTYYCFIFLVIVTILTSISKDSEISYEQWFYMSVGLAVLTHIWLAVRIYHSREEGYLKLSMHTGQLMEFFKNKSDLYSITHMPKAGVHWYSEMANDSEDEASEENSTNTEDKYHWYSQSYPWVGKQDHYHTKRSALIQKKNAAKRSKLRVRMNLHSTSNMNAV